MTLGIYESMVETRITKLLICLLNFKGNGLIGL